MDERKLRIENGQCHGEFTPGRLLPSGYYEVRAYTRYMLNFGEEAIFSRIFPILNPDDDPSEIDKKPETEPDDLSPFFDKMRKKNKPPKQELLHLHFYPEGGHLISGIPARIAFKVTDEQGKSVEIQGTLFNSQGLETGSIQTTHQGMGIFDLTPDTNIHYVVLTKGKKKYTFNLPLPLESGYSLNLVRQNETQRKAIIRKSGNMLRDTLGLAVTCRGNVVFFETIDHNQSSLELNVPEENFPEGVNRLTLFDKKGKILSDRLFFVSKKQKQNLTIATDQEAYGAFEKINLQLLFSGIPSPATFSLSVRDAGKEPASSCSNSVKSALLLSSELKGYIENPGYYFEKDDEVHTKALDLLMMV